MMKQPIKYATIGALLASTVGCGSIPQRANYESVNNYQGTVSDFSAQYAQNETALDAAQSIREVECLEKLAGEKYQSQGALYKELAQCECDQRQLDMLGYGIASTIVDGAKLYLIKQGLDSLNSTGSTSQEGGLEQTIGSGSQSSSGGSAINP